MASVVTDGQKCQLDGEDFTIPLVQRDGLTDGRSVLRKWAFTRSDRRTDRSDRRLERVNTQ